MVREALPSDLAKAVDLGGQDEKSPITFEVKHIVPEAYDGSYWLSDAGRSPDRERCEPSGASDRTIGGWTR